MSAMFKLLLDKLPVHRAKMIQRQKMNDPPYVPDHVLVNRSFTKPSWSDLHAIIEWKKLNVDLHAVACQVVGYLVHTLSNAVSDLLYRIAATSNFREIQLFYFEETDYLNGLKVKSSRKLFPKDRCQ